MNALTKARGLRIPPVIASVLLLLAMVTFGSVMYTGFFSAQVFLNLLIDNAFLLVVAVGMTFVILTGGIDLSVGSVVALTTMVSAALVEHHHWSPRHRDPAGAGGRRGVRRAPGLADPALPAAAVHRDAGGHVPGARPVLRGLHRLDQHHRADLHRHRPGPRAAVRRQRRCRSAR